MAPPFCNFLLALVLCHGYIQTWLEVVSSLAKELTIVLSQILETPDLFLGLAILDQGQ